MSTKQRIRHLFPHHGGPGASRVSKHEEDPRVPRGWITPQGHFLKTKEHWASITSHFRRPETRSLAKEEAPEEVEAAQANAHLAYSLGWISLGHAGKLNAIGHKNTFDARHHPAVLTLRKLLAEVPHLTIAIEIQIGSLVHSKGVHEDFELIECDLDILIKRGRLRAVHGR